MARKVSLRKSKYGKGSIAEINTTVAIACGNREEDDLGRHGHIMQTQEQAVFDIFGKGSNLARKP